MTVEQMEQQTPIATRIPQSPAQDLSQEVTSLVQQVTTLEIVTSSDYEQACELLKAGVAMGKNLDTLFDAQIEAAHKSHKVAIEQKKKFTGPLLAGVERLKALIQQYRQKEETKRRCEEERIRAENLKKAQLEAEQKAEEEKLAAAIAAEQSGDVETANAILASPTVVEAPCPEPVVLESSVKKQEGISFRANWKAIVVNEALVPREFLMVDIAKLSKYAKAMKEQATVAGVEFYDEQIVVGKV